MGSIIMALKRDTVAGTVKLRRVVGVWQRRESMRPSKRSRSGRRWQADYVPPRAALFRQGAASGGGRVAITPDSEVGAHCAEWPQEALRLLGRLEPPHGSFTLARRLVGVLRSVIEPLVPPMFCSGKCSPKRGGEDPTQERYGRELIAPLLHQDVEDDALIVDCPPQPVAFALDLELHPIQVPKSLAWTRRRRRSAA